MVYQFGAFTFQPTEGLRRDGIDVPLPPRALGVLAALVERAGSVVSKQTLMDTTWRDTFVTEASLLEAIRLLREALGDDRQNPTYIQTVHRRGYRFVAPVTLDTATRTESQGSRTEGQGFSPGLAEAEASALRTSPGQIT